MTNEARAELNLLKLCLARRNCNEIEVTHNNEHRASTGITSAYSIQTAQSRPTDMAELKEIIAHG